MLLVDKKTLNAGFELTMIGFPNLGNSCWLNSLLQLLLNNKWFGEALQRMSGEPFTTHLQELAANRGSISSLMKILRALAYDGTPEDSHEAFIKIIEILHQENKQIIDAASTTMMQQVTKHTDNSISLPLALFQGVMRYENSDKAEIFEPFTTFFLEPSLGRNYNIGVQMEQTFLKRQIVKMPPLLMVCFDRLPGQFTLLEEFSLNTPQGTVFRYKCTGFVLHCGSVTSGHYFTICKANKNWYVFDDNSVRPYDPSNFSLSGCTPRLVLFSKS
jgi:hypothetical protein